LRRVHISLPKCGIGKDAVDVAVFVAFVVNEAISEMKTSSLLHVAIVKVRLWSLGDKGLALGLRR